MVKARGDGRTLDLLSWQPPEPTRSYPEEKVRAASLHARIAQAVSLTLKECGMSREDVAARMSQSLGETVTKNMLDAYASAAREEHNISFARVIALTMVTGDARPLQLAAGQIGHSVVSDHFLPWITVGQLADRKESVNGSYEFALRTARKGQP